MVFTHTYRVETLDKGWSTVPRRYFTASSKERLLFPVAILSTAAQGLGAYDLFRIYSGQHPVLGYFGILCGALVMAAAVLVVFDTWFYYENHKKNPPLTAEKLTLNGHITSHVFLWAFVVFAVLTLPAAFGPMMRDLDG